MPFINNSAEFKFDRMPEVQPYDRKPDQEENLHVFRVLISDKTYKVKVANKGFIPSEVSVEKSNEIFRKIVEEISEQEGVIDAISKTEGVTAGRAKGKVHVQFSKRTKPTDSNADKVLKSIEKVFIRHFPHTLDPTPPPLKLEPLTVESLLENPPTLIRGIDDPSKFEKQTRQLNALLNNPEQLQHLRKIAKPLRGKFHSVFRKSVRGIPTEKQLKRAMQIGLSDPTIRKIFLKTDPSPGSADGRMGAFLINWILYGEEIVLEMGIPENEMCFMTREAQELKLDRPAFTTEINNQTYIQFMLSSPFGFKRVLEEYGIDCPIHDTNTLIDILNNLENSEGLRKLLHETPEFFNQLEKLPKGEILKKVHYYEAKNYVETFIKDVMNRGAKIEYEGSVWSYNRDLPIKERMEKGVIDKVRQVALNDKQATLSIEEDISHLPLGIQGLIQDQDMFREFILSVDDEFGNVLLNKLELTEDEKTALLEKKMNIDDMQKVLRLRSLALMISCNQSTHGLSVGFGRKTVPLFQKLLILENCVTSTLKFRFSLSKDLSSRTMHNHHYVQTTSGNPFPLWQFHSSFKGELLPRGGGNETRPAFGFGFSPRAFLYKYGTKYFYEIAKEHYTSVPSIP